VEVDSLSDEVKARFKLYQFATAKIAELNNMKALLHRAKQSYIDAMKLELLSNKSGFLFDGE
jgi:hypothetical protein